MKKDLIKILESEKNTNGNITSNEEIISWMDNLLENTKISVKECLLDDNSFWFL